MRLRAEAFVFALAVVVGWALSAALGLSAAQPVGAEGLIVSPDQARSALSAGAEARRKGDFAAADRLYRQAWTAPSTRAEAARALRELHRIPGFHLPVDEPALAQSAELLGESFRRHETANFVILSDADRDWTLNKAALLERAAHQFFRVMDRLEYPAMPPRHKLHCVLFKDHAMYAAFARAHDGVDAPWIAGYYAGLSNRVVFYDDRTSPAFVRAFEQLTEYERGTVNLRNEARQASRSREEDRARNLWARADEVARHVQVERTRLSDEAEQASQAKTIHEAIHLLAFNCGVQSRAHQYPFWITEGLASAFETERPESAFGPDHPTGARQTEFERHLSEGRLFDVPTLVELIRPPDTDSETADVMYSQSYALVAHLYRVDRRGLTNYLGSVMTEPPGFIAPQRHGEMFRAAFGEPAGVERRWLRR